LFRSPTAVDAAQADSETKRLLTEALQIDQYAITKDAVTIVAFPWQHSSLNNVWPENGCVNLRHPAPETGDINDKWVVARCQDYLEQVILRHSNDPPKLRTDIAGAFNEFTVSIR